jgi:uncharacterized SAM-binding protein YcdF (DUF218 family)
VRKSLFQLVGDFPAYVAGWLECEDMAAPTDCLLVPAGAEFALRLFSGLDLLRRRFAPRLLLSAIAGIENRAAEQAARADPSRVQVFHHDAATARGEAAEARKILERLGCMSVVIVSSASSSRRARLVFRRAFAGTRIQVRLCPVRPRVWSGVRGGRSGRDMLAVAEEFFKLFAAWLHWDWALVPAAEDGQAEAEERRAA